jgi:type VI secretion system protein ImpK
MQDAISNLVHPILAYGLGLKARLDRGESPTIEIEQAALKGMLQSEIESRRYAAFGGDVEKSAEEGRGRGGQSFLGIRYALTCWLDELFIVDSKWSTAWNERKLELALYGTNDRAWKFWVQARLAEGRGIDALEGYLLCVMLGFRGEFRDEPDRLGAWVTAAQTQVGRGYGQKWPAPPELDAPSNVPPLHGAERLRTLAVAWFVVLLVMVPALMLVQYLGKTR